jgi:hypothetical protein
MADMKPARAPLPAENPTDAIERRIAELENWLQENEPESLAEQRHLDEDTAERAYWHYGYAVALKDVLALLKGKRRSLH